MTAVIIELPRREPEHEPVSIHWLIFGPEHTDPDIAQRPITGCACGYRADLNEDHGFGDSVVDHLLEVGANAAR